MGLIYAGRGEEGHEHEKMTRDLDEMANETMQTCGEPGDIVAIIEGMLAERDALPPLSEPEPEPWMWCPACLERSEGQLAHMEPGGCMAPGL